MSEGSDGGGAAESEPEGEGVENEENQSEDSNELGGGKAKEGLIKLLSEHGFDSEDLSEKGLEDIVELAKSSSPEYKSSKGIGWYDRFIESLPAEIRWILYAIRGFTDNSKEEDIYKKILSSDERYVTLFFSGLLGIPYEQYFGEDIIRVGTHDVEEINKYIEFAQNAGYKVRLIGYSGGSRRIRNYVKKYGNEKINDILILGGIVNVPGAYHINAEKDRIIPFFRELYRALGSIPYFGREFKEISDNPVKPNAVIRGIGHWDLIFKPEVIEKVKDYFSPNISYLSYTSFLRAA